MPHGLVEEQIACAHVGDEVVDVVRETGRRVGDLSPNCLDQVRDGPFAVDQLPDEAADLVDAVVLTRLEVQKDAALSCSEDAKGGIRILPGFRGVVDRGSPSTGRACPAAARVAGPGGR